MRNAGDFELMDIQVQTVHGADKFERIRSFSADQYGTLHVHDALGPVALYSARSGWVVTVVSAGKS